MIQNLIFGVYPIIWDYLLESLQANKTSKKGHSFYNTVSLNIIKKSTTATQPKTLPTLQIFHQKCFWLVVRKKHLHWIISRLPENTGLVSSGVSLTSWGEVVSLALVGNPSSDGITIKIPYGVDALLHRPASHPIFSYWVG